jgi:hypothetical protein
MGKTSARDFNLKLIRRCFAFSLSPLALMFAIFDAKKFINPSKDFRCLNKHRH